MVDHCWFQLQCNTEYRHLTSSLYHRKSKNVSALGVSPCTGTGLRRLRRFLQDTVRTEENQSHYDNFWSMYMYDNKRAQWRCAIICKNTVRNVRERKYKATTTKQATRRRLSDSLSLSLSLSLFSTPKAISDVPGGISTSLGTTVINFGEPRLRFRYPQCLRLCRRQLL